MSSDASPSCCPTSLAGLPSHEGLSNLEQTAHRPHGIAPTKLRRAKSTISVVATAGSIGPARAIECLGQPNAKLLEQAMQGATGTNQGHNYSKEGLDGVFARIIPQVGNQALEFGDKVGNVSVARAALVIGAGAAAGEEGRGGASVAGACVAAAAGAEETVRMAGAVIIVAMAATAAASEEAHPFAVGLQVVGIIAIG